MRFHFSVLVCLFLALTIFCFSCVFAESSDYPWGMDKASVINQMGKKGEEDSTSSPGNLLLRYYGQHISIFDATLVYAFRNDALFARMYGIQDDSAQAYTYLGEALNVKYGISKDDSTITLDALKVMMGLNIDKATLEIAEKQEMIIYKTWTPSETTNIVLIFIPNESESMTALFYIQPSDIISNKQYNFDGL